MADTSLDERNHYVERTKVYRETIDRLLKEEKILQARIREGEEPAVQRIALAESKLNLCACYIILNGISLSMFRVKNEEALSDGRNSLYNCVICMEELVTNYVDAAFSEYEERQADLHFLNAGQRYYLMCKMGLAIHLLENAYGNNSKWRWSFVDLEGRYAAVAKNIFDLKSAVTNTDPRSPWYEPAMYHLRLIKQLLRHAADRYRQKYELFTKDTDDFIQGINFLGSLRRIHVMMGEREDAEMVKKQLDSWSNKLDTDIKQKMETAAKDSSGSIGL